MVCYTAGLDLGQARDYSALAVVERVERFEGPSGESTFEPGPYVVDEWHVRHLQRWELGTPYPSVVEQVGELLQADRELAEAHVAIDGTGVGRAVVDLFTDAYRQGRLGDRYPSPVTITAGRDVHGFHVPKLQLVSKVQAALQSGRLRVADGLALGEQLSRELLAFRAKITGAGTATFEAEHERDHDDLVVAVALGVWFPQRSGEPRFVTPEGEVREKHAGALVRALPD